MATERAPDTRRAKLVVYAVIAFTAIYGVVLSFHFSEINAGHRAETDLAALNLLKLGYIGNPYNALTGPTAHVPPGLIAIMALSFRLFGQTGPQALIALSLVATMMFAAGQVAVVQVLDFRRASWASYAILAAVFICTVPDVFEFVVLFRNWDQPYGATLLIASWALLERSRAYGTSLIGIGLMAGLLVVASWFSVAILPPIAVALGMMIWTLRPRTQRRSAALVALCIVVAGLAPWTIRNQIMLGRPILTRSNFPLELALGNLPGENGGPAPSEQEFLRAHHPFFSPAAAKEMAEIGEARFMDGLSTLTINHIRSHKLEFVRATLARIGTIVMPLPQLEGWYPGLPFWVVALFGTVMLLLRLTALAVSAVIDRALLFDGLVFTALPLLPYTITHPDPRYMATIEFASATLIVLCAGRLVEAVKSTALRSRTNGARI